MQRESLRIKNMRKNLLGQGFEGCSSNFFVRVAAATSLYGSHLGSDPFVYQAGSPYSFLPLGLL